MRWDLLTSPELDALDRRIPVILSVSATEQHGRHLPLATDRLIGEHFLTMLDREAEHQVLLLPSMAIGCSAHHLAFAGSLSLSHQTFLMYAKEILVCVIEQGFHNIIIFNSHGGNQGIGTVLQETLGHQFPQCHIVLASWWKLANRELLELNESGKGGTGHAGEFETSLLMHFASHLVRTGALEDGRHAPTFEWNDSDMLYSSRASLYRSMKQTCANGVFGCASAASAEKGRAITDIVLVQMKRIVEDLYHHE